MNPWRSLRGLPRAVWVLAAATLVNRAGSMVLPFMAIYLTRERHLAPELAGGIIAAYGGTSLVAAPLAGRLGDRLGSRRLGTGLLALSGVMMLLFPLAKSVPGLIAATVGLALLAEGFRPVSMSLFAELTPPAMRKQGFALSRMAINLGMTIGPALGGLLAERHFAALFVVDGATSIAAAVLLFAMLERGAPSADPSRQSEAAPDAGAGRPYRDARFLFFLAPVLLSALVFFQLDAALPLYLVNGLGFPTSRFGLLMSINTVIIIFLEVPLNAAIEGWPMRRALALGAVLVAVGFSAMGVVSGFWGAAVTIVIWTVGEMILSPASAAYVAELAPAGRAGEYMGFYSMTYGAAFTLGPWAGVALMERYGAPALWLAILVVGLAAAFMFALVRPTRRDDAQGLCSSP